jgi:carbonic anhydrase
VIKGRSSLEAIAPNLVEWLAHAEPSRGRLAREPKLDPSRPEGDRLSQANVLQQLEHIATFAPVRKRLATGQVRMHGLWFDLEHAMVSLWEPEHGRFVPLDEAEVERLLAT